MEFSQCRLDLPPRQEQAQGQVQEQVRGLGQVAGGRRRINFNVRVRVDRPAEWAEMFDDGWRTMKYRFYDPQMHGMDWDAARTKYRPLVDFVGDRQEVSILLTR
jgi:tricorn protease